MDAKIIYGGRCVICGTPIKDSNVFLCDECEKDTDYALRKNAIKWLEMICSKGVSFDDYSDETAELREWSTHLTINAYKVAIHELTSINNGKYIPVSWLEGLLHDSTELSYSLIDGVINVLEYWSRQCNLK